MLPNKSPPERTQAFCHTSGRSGPTQHGWALCWSLARRGQGQTVLSSEAWCPLLSSLRRLAELSSLWVKNGGPSVLAGCWPRVTLMHSQALALWLAARCGSLLWRPWGQITYSEVLSDWSGSPRIISLLITRSLSREWHPIILTSPTHTPGKGTVQGQYTGRVSGPSQSSACHSAQQVCSN